MAESVVRDTMDYDVVIVGAGPAGLAAAIRLKHRARETGGAVSVCVLEKGSEVGAHILSGAVLDPAALNELLPDWRERGAPVTTVVTGERFLLLGQTSAWTIPGGLLPPLMRNHGNYVISLGLLCRWLAREAEALGVEIYPGFAAAQLFYGEDGRVGGVITGDSGVARDGTHKPAYTPGMALRAKYTLIAEGARGSLTRQIEERFHLRRGAGPQKYGLGLKELWRVDPANHRPGLVLHTLGWPLDGGTGGGGFVYHGGDNQVAVGFVVHLDYENPYLNPFEEFQRFKTHAAIRSHLQGGERLAYGARAITEGGLQCVPDPVFPGGALIGCAAGFVNVPRIKGIHNAITSGIVAADAVCDAIRAGRGDDVLATYPQGLRSSPLWRDLDAVRNVKPAVSRFGTWMGTLYGGLDLWLHSLGLRVPWTLRHRAADHTTLRDAAAAAHIHYPKPDGVVSFDKLSSVYLANVSHEEDQPVHLRLNDPDAAIRVNRACYDAPEQRYCPAGVYEIVTTGRSPRLQINAANCIHCKACDIKDPLQNIVWTVPEGGGGPNYSAM
jgi:electron-transferring-flavoprotein dehydrogenase